MRGKLTELWHRHLDRKPWVFRDRFGLAYLFTAQDDVAEHCEQGAVLDNAPFLTYLQSAVKSGETFIDLSPEVGGVTMLVARQVKETGGVFAFAPDVNTYRQLVNNVALNSLTAAVRVIGRAVLAVNGKAPAITLDQFAAEWRLGCVDYLRLKDISLLSALESSAVELFKSGRVHRLLFDEVDSASFDSLLNTLSQRGFTAQTLSAEGTLQPLPTVVSGRITVIATRTEAVHA